MGQGDKLIVRSPEKAVLGGSTPRLATIFLGRALQSIATN
jgi:hypothetical protein